MSAIITRFLPLIVVLSAVLVLAVEPLFAGIRREPMPHAITSPSGEYIFTMIPGKNGGLGVCYGIGDDGAFIERWKSSGWYSEDIVLENDGIHLVRIGSWRSRDQDGLPPLESLAIAFYRRGELIKQYLVGDLVMDPASLISSSAGMQWLGNLRRADLESGGQYALITTDGFEYVFDTATGLIKKRTNRFPVIHVSNEQDGSLVKWRLHPDAIDSLKWDGVGELPFDKDRIENAVYEWMMWTYGSLAYENIEIRDPVRLSLLTNIKGWFYIVNLSAPKSKFLPTRTQVILTVGGRFAFKDRAKDDRP
jgi:hypothetical protein